MSFLTDCKTCSQTFKSRRSLLKHHQRKHLNKDLPSEIDFYDNNGAVANLPGAKELPYGEVAYYEQWLVGLVECVNGSLHPQLSGEVP